MNVDIFIKSYNADLQWLAYCLKAIRKYATGFRDVIVVLPDDCGAANLTQEKVIYLPEHPRGYLWQQICKLNADLYSDADYILHIDCDCILSKPVTPETFLNGNKPVWWVVPFSKSGEQEQLAWKEVMARFMGTEPDHEFMRRCTILLPRWAYREYRAHILAQHCVTMQEYVFAQPQKNFSEWNTLGFYLHEFHREAFHWIDTSVESPNPVARQFWSQSPIRQHVQELEAITR